jgi:hypothetical protein
MRIRDLQRGSAAYQDEMQSRSQQENNRDHQFDELASRYSSLSRPHFTRRELELILTWKHTHRRWLKAALDGLAVVSDSAIRSATNRIATIDDPRVALQEMARFARGVGDASISAILTAARPDSFRSD